jgi:hypothetical protein
MAALLAPIRSRHGIVTCDALIHLFKTGLTNFDSLQ